LIYRLKLLFFTLFTIFFASGVAAASTLSLNENVGHYPLGRYLDVLEDPAKTWTIEDVLTPSVNDQFVTSTTDVPNLGYSSSAYWIKLQIVVDAATSGEWFLELDYPHMDKVEIYVAVGDRYEKFSAGDLLPFSDRLIEPRLIEHRNFVFKLMLLPGESNVIYARVESRGTIRLPFSLWNKEVFYHTDSTSNLFYGAFYGVVLVMAIYNLFIFFVIRDRSYLFYVLFIASNAMANASFMGYGSQLFWPDNVWWANCSVLVFGAFLAFFGCLFTQGFLNTKKYTPGLHKVLWLIAMLCIAQIGISLYPSTYSIAVRTGSLIVVAFTITAIYTGAMCWVKGVRPARYFTVASSGYLLGMLAWHLAYNGVFPVNIVTSYGQQYGTIFEIILLSLGLADRINVFREDAIKARVDARNALHDTLTGLPSLKLGQEKCEESIEISKKENCKLAIMFIDLDGFKSVNDTYGHAIGDRLLKDVANRFSNCIREDDTIARIGGDEFIFILNKVKDEMAPGRAAQRLISSLDVPFSFKEVGKDIYVGASIGIAVYPDHGHEMKVLFKRADEAMYKTKHSGKNNYTMSDNVNV